MANVSNVRLFNYVEKPYTNGGDVMLTYKDAFKTLASETTITGKLYTKNSTNVSESSRFKRTGAYVTQLSETIS